MTRWAGDVIIMIGYGSIGAAAYLGLHGYRRWSMHEDDLVVGMILHNGSVQNCLLVVCK